MPNKKKRYNGLTHEERMVCLNILAGYNQTEAYKIVHPKASANSAAALASKMLKKVKVSNFLDERRALLCNKAEKKAEDVIRELENIGFSNIANYLSFKNKQVILKNSDEIPGELLVVIESVSSTDTAEGKKISLKLYDKVDALKALGQYHKLFRQDDPYADKEYTIRVVPIPK